jgi:hypothetical protein
MRHTILLALLFAGPVGISGDFPAPVQRNAPDRSEFRARLSVVPIDVAMQRTIAGHGRVSATLSGETLTITGDFADLKTPATVARIHNGAKGIRGPAVFDLTVSKSTSGTISGTVTLTSQQIEELKRSRFYVQVHSEKAPEGNLWGWLLPTEARK